ncbi:MAG: ATP-binding protein [Ferruginibacter sp.]
MKKTITFVFIVFFNHALFAQIVKIDSLKKVLVNATDTARVNILNELSTQYSGLYSYTESDTSLIAAQHYADKALALARKNNFIKGIANALFNSAVNTDKSPTENKQVALTAYQAALPYLKQSNNEIGVATCMQGIAESYHTIGELEQAILYFDSVTQIVQRSGDISWSVYTTAMKGHCYFDMGNYRDAYEIGTSALKLAERTNDTHNICIALSHLENLYLGAGLPQTAIEYMHKILRYYPSALTNVQGNLPWEVYWVMIKGGEAFLQLNELDSALKISKSAPEDARNPDNYLFYGHLYTAQHQYNSALSFFTKGLEVETQSGHLIGIARHANELGRIYSILDKFNLAIKYANDALISGKKMHALLEMKNAVGTLLDIYTKTKNYKQIYNYSQLFKSLNDSLASDEYRRKLSLVQIQNELDNEKQQAVLLGKENELKQQQLSKAALARKFFIAGITAVLLIAVIIFRSYRHKQKANIALQHQKEKVESTLQELKSTQSQLIQSEKMASLGELTAGIAHEIQNPLNFVNNFSDVSTELIDEMNTEIDNGNLNNAKLLAQDLKQNLEKINHHGKRAGDIVKGMLQHSRSSSGQKEPTDINALADEYLRLAYHGLRAKDKSFNAAMKTDFDDSLGKINLIPQDIGRVILNLITNAFYVVDEKKKSGIENYEPTVSVSTKKIKGNAEIRVSDNGNGVPQKVLDKIFQPFFTTKPTGQGTGLGLSLSYDIVKAHGGELTVETKEGVGSVFIISLPVSKS